MKTYLGIDYGNGISNISPAGIRYGVISSWSVSPESLDDAIMQAIDLTYEQAVSDAKTAIGAISSVDELAAWLDEVIMLQRGETAIALARYIADGQTASGDCDTLVPSNELTEYIWSEIEDRWKDAYWMNDCGDRDWLYESDGYKLTNCLQSDVMVIGSPYYTYAQFCSPCVPGACNLDSPLVTPPDNSDADWQKLRDNRAYCLGHDWFEDGQAPYPVYSVATGELVSPKR